ncbi:MAG: response regulator transcription factor [Pyrinomonadaceae bacterium]|nr:response regulator transcription factor [Pyrinomonadaceae bacterium]
MEKILIIDDDEDLCELVGEYLEVEGFSVEAVHDGAEGLEKAAEGEQDLVILDVMLPSKNGFDVLRDLRAESNTPVLMLTARGDDMERIVGLEIGADDYMPKPFNPRELVARIRAILRRAEPVVESGSPEKLIVEDLEISKSGRTVLLDGDKIALTAIEFELLVYLLENAGKVIEKEELSLQVLERELSPFDRSLDMHVSNLRKKLGKRSDGENRIKTVRSVGYIYALTD